MSDDTIDATAHGAGENFPLDATGEQLDTAAPDGQRVPIDRRVELFFFDPEFGITPPPPGQNSGPGSTEYPTWRKRVSEVVELHADDPKGPKVIFIEMADAHFRTDSAVVLPEGEDPDKTGAHQALTSVGVIATALRFNEEHPGRTLLVAGHTDTANTPTFNQPLSEERAQLALAMLEGGDESRETFKSVAQGRHTVADIKQILSWAARALTGFDCDPGAIDDNLASATEPIRSFQNSYSANRATIAPNSTDDLTPDGSVGPLTWGAIFDCYEFTLRQELGEDATGLQALRDKLAFVDPDHKFLGFSEYFPIEELGVDNFRSQTNRRVEILFFEKGEEPDIQHALDDPETSDLYLPGHYERTPLEPVAKIPGGGLVFEYGVQVGNGVPWSLQASLVFTSADNSDIQTFALAAGVTSGLSHIVSFPNSRQGLKYSGAVVEGQLRIELFGPVELFRVADPNDDVNDLPIADAVAPLPEQPPDPVSPTAATGTQDGLPPGRVRGQRC